MKKSLYIIITAITLGLLLTVAEYMAHRAGLELRTFAQVIKGSYLWLVMPYTVLFSGNTLLKQLQENRFRTLGQAKVNTAISWLRRILVILFFLAISFISFLRGVFYVFSEEMVTEKLLPDGYLQGTWSVFLSESHYDYYVPVAFFFRKPLNWTAKQLTDKVQERYSPDSELVERQEGGWYVFRTPDSLAEGEYIYFHASDSYNATSNAFFQILLSEASHFWNHRGRPVTLSSSGATLEASVDTGERLTYPFSTGKLYITCDGSVEDIAACAADLTDWLQFVKDAGQLPYGTDWNAASLLTNMCIGIGNDYFPFDISPLDDFIGDDSWEIRYERMDAALTEAFKKHLIWLETQKGIETEPEKEEEAYEGMYDSLFMDTYRGDYEKECLIGDGTIRYRMVVRDAALGSRLYSLLKSTDSGKTWQMASSVPFGEDWGMGIDFTFLDEDFGFATLMHNGGDEADLYVTEDGGNTYHPVVMEAYSVTLEDGYTYNPYDYPQMPYEEDGIIYVLCGQGMDGDYAGGDSAGLALYQSKDRGHTFTFAGILSSRKED